MFRTKFSGPVDVIVLAKFWVTSPQQISNPFALGSSYGLRQSWFGPSVKDWKERYLEREKWSIGLLPFIVFLGENAGDHWLCIALGQVVLEDCLQVLERWTWRRRMIFPGSRCFVTCPGILHYTKSQVGVLDISLKCLGVSWLIAEL